MEEHGVYLPLDEIDMRALIYLSDKVAKKRQNDKQAASMRSRKGRR